MRLGRTNAMRAGFPLLKKRAGINLRAWCTVLPQHDHVMGGCVFLCGDCVHAKPQLVSIPIRAGLVVLPKNAKFMDNSIESHEKAGFRQLFTGIQSRD